MKNICVLVKISLKIVPKGPNNNKLALVQIMAWHLACEDPLPETMMARYDNAWRLKSAAAWVFVQQLVQNVFPWAHHIMYVKMVLCRYHRCWRWVIGIRQAGVYQWVWSVRCGMFLVSVEHIFRYAKRWPAGARSKAADRRGIWRKHRHCAWCPHETPTGMIVISLV